MNFIIFQIKRFLIFLSESFLYPFRKLTELWSDPKRGRSMIFGLPALLVAIVAIAAVLIAMGSQNRLLENYDVARDNAEKKKEWKEAVVYAYKVTQLRPDDDASKWDLARVLGATDDSDEKESNVNKRTAMAILRLLSPLDKPRYPQAHVWRANEFFAFPPNMLTLEKKIELAETQLNFALDTDPDNIDALIIKAERIHIPKKEFQEALDIYIKLFDKYIAYYVKIAELCHRLGKEESAYPYLEEASRRYKDLLDEDPLNMNYLRRRANAEAMLGNHDKAIELLISAASDAKDPGRRKEIQTALAKIYLARATAIAPNVKDPAMQLEFLDHVILAYQTDPENESAKTALTRFGFSTYEHSPRALEAYDPRDNPDDASDVSLNVAGTYEILKGDRALGIRLLGQAIQKNPKNHEALNNLAFSIHIDDVDRALNLSNRAIQSSPGRPEYYDTRGNIYMKKGDWEKAIVDLEKAKELLEFQERELTYSLFDSLATCYAELGMPEAAVNREKANQIKARDGANENRNR